MFDPHRGLFVFCVLVTALALGILIVAKDQPAVIVVSALFILGGGISAAALGVEWLVMVMAWSHREHADANAITPFSKAAALVQSLTAEQLSVLPQFEQMVRVGHTLTPTGVESFLITSQANVPYKFIIEFLQVSGYAFLQPINKYHDKTPDRLFAETFTAWLILRGFALPAIGPHSAQWVSGDSRAAVAEMLGIELEANV